MAYKALYRSYRPNSFSAVVGQEHIIKTLKNALVNNKTSHAYIFSGPRGIGKTTIARILAKAINCENLQEGEPCNRCSACKLINNNETPDIIEFDAASNNGVEEIRNVLEKVNFLPGVLKHKVYIIDEVHMLSISAFNALLKTLEEPPAHVMFILATTEPHKIPATILSRCQRFDFKPLTIKEIKANLQVISEKEKIAVEDEALNLVAEASEGGMRDAIGILDQVNAYSTKTITLEDVNNVTGRISNQKLIELMQALHEGNSVKAVEITNDLLALGKEVSRLTQSLLQLCRDILLYQSTDGEIDGKLIYDDMSFKMLCNDMNKKKLFYYIDILSDTQNKIKFSLSQKIFLEVGIMKMANANKEDYDVHISAETGMIGVEGVIPLEFDEKISTLETQINKIKSELVKLNLSEFQEETKGKLNLLEDITSKAMFGNDTNNFDERIKQLETKILEPSTISLEPVYNELNEIKNQLNANNNIELIQRIEVLENNKSSVPFEELEKLEASIQLAFNQMDEVSTRVKELEMGHKDSEPTLFDFAKPSNDEELEELRIQCKELKEQVELLQQTYNNVEESLSELILSSSKEKAAIQKRDNPYEQKVLDIVTTQRALEAVEEIVEAQPETDIVEQEQVELVETTSVETLIEDEQPQEAIEENDVELPEEMSRPIDDFFTNPVYFNKPLEETEDKTNEETKVEEPQTPVVAKEVSETKPAEKTEPVQFNLYDLLQNESPKEETKLVVEPIEEKTPTIDDFEVELEEELHYELNCNVSALEKDMNTMANADVVPLDVLNRVVANLDGMKEDINKFIQDKQNGIFIEHPSLEKDANRNIKTFLIMLSVKDAMEASVKDKETAKLITTLKDLIKQFRHAKDVVRPVEEPVLEKASTSIEVVNEPIEENVSVEESKVEEPQTPVAAEEEVVISEPVVEEKNEEAVEDIYEKVEEATIIEEQNTTEEIKEEESQTPVVTEEVVENKSFELDNLVINEEATPTPEPPKPAYTHSTVIDTTPRTLEAMAKNIPDENPYAIEKIEMVMHDSRSEISREERKIILNGWRRLGDRVGTALSPVARFLMDGQPVVNGNNCIIITYPNAALCNHIMGDKIRFEAKQILKITFGREYDFIALPENVWQEKRNEYRGQYQMGTRFPKLTPINNPELRIIKKSFVDEKNASYNKALDLFGENLIKEEEE